MKRFTRIFLCIFVYLDMKSSKIVFWTLRNTKLTVIINKCCQISTARNLNTRRHMLQVCHAIEYVTVAFLILAEFIILLTFYLNIEKFSNRQLFFFFMYIFFSHRIWYVALCDLYNVYIYSYNTCVFSDSVYVFRREIEKRWIYRTVRV